MVLLAINTTIVTTGIVVFLIVILILVGCLCQQARRRLRPGTGRQLLKGFGQIC